MVRWCHTGFHKYSNFRNKYKVFPVHNNRESISLWEFPGYKLFTTVEISKISKLSNTTYLSNFLPWDIWFWSYVFSDICIRNVLFCNQLIPFQKWKGLLLLLKYVVWYREHHSTCQLDSHATFTAISYPFQDM